MQGVLQGEPRGQTLVNFTPAQGPQRQRSGLEGDRPLQPGAVDMQFDGEEPAFLWNQFLKQWQVDEDDLELFTSMKTIRIRDFDLIVQ
jgi:hypothetical protein